MRHVAAKWISLLEHQGCTCITHHMGTRKRRMRDDRSLKARYAPDTEARDRYPITREQWHSTGIINMVSGLSSCNGRAFAICAV